MIKFGSICSGIEAASAAWEPLGWKAAWFSEIEPFPNAVLTHHYPKIPNLGDMTAPDFTKRAKKLERVDVIVGGTPCQAFSVAGKRESLKDDRGNLSLKFTEIIHAIRPTIVLWENVPGVLNTPDNAFGCFLAGLAGATAPLEPPQTDGKARALCLAPSMASLGGSLMPNFSECPNDAIASSLSDILETGDVPRKYYLSPTACKGILRRAAHRGKELPEKLAIALKKVADLSKTPPTKPMSPMPSKARTSMPRKTGRGEGRRSSESTHGKTPLHRKKRSR